MGEDSLQGASVLVTRAREDQGLLEALLVARGARPVLLPCIELVAPRDPAPLEAALGRLSAGERPDFVVLASAHAAERFFGLLRARGVDPTHALRGVRLAVAGPGTAQALRRLGVLPAVAPAEGVGAEALARALAPLVRDKDVLVLRAEDGNPALAARLEEAGARVRAVPLYRTVAVREADPAAAAALREGQIAAIAFASGSAARGFASLFGAEASALASRCRVVCMGANCAAAAREAGLPVHVESEGGFPELVDALSRALSVC